MQRRRLVITPGAILRSEHALIERVLDALIAVAERVAAGASPPAPLLRGALEFIGSFVDDCHHAKEDLLFDALRARAVPARLIRDLRAQHADARSRLARLRAAVVAVSPGLPAALREYVQTLRAHLAREDAELLPALDVALPAARAVSLADAWNDLEARVGGPAVRAALVELAETISRAGRAGRPAAAPTPTARDIMRPDVPPVSPGDSLARAADVMGRLATRELPVVADGRLVGIVTRRDLEPHVGHLEWTTVGTAMTPEPVTVAPDTPAAAVANLLLSGAFNAVPVAADGTLLGMVGRADLLRLLAVP